MTMFVDTLVDRLPMASPLQKRNNPLRVVLDRTIGAWFEENGDVFEELFLMTATGGWLDAHGRDYGVPRRLGESDDDYRERIVFEKLEYLNARNLIDFYGLDLYVSVDDFDASDNTLTSDNPFIGGSFMSFVSVDVQNILNAKFILGDELEWL